jgi:hypothetical protein
LRDRKAVRQHYCLGAAVTAGGEQLEGAAAVGLGAASAAQIHCRHGKLCLRQIDAMPQDKITIYGPKPDGTYVVEFKMADGEALAISVPASETRVLKYFQERTPYGLFVPDVA